MCRDGPPHFYWHSVGWIFVTWPCKGAWEYTVLLPQWRTISTVVYPSILVDIVTTNVISVLIRVFVTVIKFYDQSSLGRKGFISS